ncbi:MAG TPA: lysozyme inhibitor LprI family protein [Streptosporangiaceae bacterium]|nr:lysozyme inhibitor LprI family protein [Streptosporangiaceae bacterium]
MGRWRRRGPRAGVVAAGHGLVRTVIVVAALGGLAACGGGTPGSTTPSASPAVTSSATQAASPAAAASTAAFAAIVEPFDPGHPARTESAPATCTGLATTVATEQCYQAKTETTDAAIDVVQLGLYQSGSPAQRSAILADDGAWLSERGPVCAKAFQGGGSIDEVDIATCLLDESTARLNAVKGINPPEAMLTSTDNTDPSALSWYTTPKGSRIAMADTQGDGSGGAIIAWVIVAGSAGFVVNPSQFYYSDGSFADHGKIVAPNPSGYRVPPGAQYTFNIDYTRLSADPDSGKGAGGYVYAPGVPVAIWH